MARYTVHVPTQQASREARLERAILVREGWSWGAFFFGPLWLFWHRHWFAGILTFLALGFFSSVMRSIPMHDLARVAAGLPVILLLGLEGVSLRRLALNWAGYAEEALVVAASRDEAERRFFDAAVEIPAEPRSPASPAPFPAIAVPGPVLGLFPDPGRRP